MEYPGKIVANVPPAAWHKKELPISIFGTGAEYPPYEFNSDDLSGIAHAHFPESPAVEKTLVVSRNSGIQQRYTVLPPEQRPLPGEQLPTIADADRLFKEYGIPLALKASKKALESWGGSPSDITHIIAVTCTNTSNPGFEVALARMLGLPKNAHRTLLHGVACAGGASALRTAYGQLLASTVKGQPGRALVIACEITSIFVWAELEHITNTKEVSPAVALFGDCASALVLSNGIAVKEGERAPIWDVLNAQTALIEGSEDQLEYNIHAAGYISTISKSVLTFTSSSLPNMFHEMVTSTFGPEEGTNKSDPREYDWVLHPGGLKILQTAQTVLGLDEDHLRGSYEIYRSRGNTSSTTVLSILDSLRLEMDTGGKGRDNLVVAAFGPGIIVEMALLRRSSVNSGTI